MIITEAIALKTLGGAFVGWTLSKFCDKTILVSHEALAKRLGDNGLDPNHDIERAVLTAHYKALKFIVDHTFSQKADKRVEKGSARWEYLRKEEGFKRIFESIDDGKFAGLVANMAGDWQTVIPTSFEPSQTLGSLQKTISPDYIKQAKADLLSLANWTEVEKEALSEWAAHPDLGWVPSFSACLREQIKINDAFYNIFSATRQEHQLRALTSIEAQLKTHLAPNKALEEAMSRVEESLKRIEGGVNEANARLERIEEKIDQSVKRQHYENEVGHQYPNFLAKLLIKSDVNEGLWEDEITTALTRYVTGKAQLEKQTNLPHHLEVKRTEALALYKEAKLDEGEAILRELVETVTLEKLESAARDHAGLLIDQVSFATAKQDLNHALDLYEQAANTIVAIDKHQAINWLWEAGHIANTTGDLFDEGFLKKAVPLYLSAIAHCCDRVGSPLPENAVQWAAIQNSLGIVYQIMGERGEAEALGKAVIAYEAALTVRTQDAAPMQWAATQNNLGNVYRIMGERGEAEALSKAVIAYKSALTVRKQDVSRMDWAITKCNLGDVYYTMGEQGENYAKAVIAYKAALSVFTQTVAPMYWAMTIEKIGYVYWVLDDREEAHKCFKQALSEFKKQDARWNDAKRYIEKLEKTMRKRGMKP